MARAEGQRTRCAPFAEEDALGWPESRGVSLLHGLIGQPLQWVLAPVQESVHQYTVNLPETPG